MKEAIGGVSLFNIVIVFVLLFAGYISLSINYSKAYNVKNEIINIIKNQGGVCTSATPNSNNNCYNFSEQITDYFRESNYRSTGECDVNDGWVGFNREGLIDYNNSAFCVKAVRANTNSELPNALYYQVRVFYQLDLPVINSFFEFVIYGESGRIYKPNDCDAETGDRRNYPWCSGVSS